MSRIMPLARRRLTVFLPGVLMVGLWAGPLPAPADEPNGPGRDGSSLTVAGLDLTTAPVHTDLGEMPELYRRAAADPSRYEHHPHVFQMPLPAAEPASVWLEYPAGKGVFFIQGRTDRDIPSTERTWGPFAGDPFERLNLEDTLRKTLTEGDFMSDAFYRVKLMLRTGERGLAERALRLLSAAATDALESLELEQNHRQVGEILAESRERIVAAGLADRLPAIEARLAAMDAKIDTRLATLPAEDYRTAADVAAGRKLPAEIPAAAWGGVVGGLRLAAVPTSLDFEGGAVVPIDLVVENVGTAEIRFGISDALQGARAEAVDAAGKPVRTESIWYSGVSPIERYRLAPGERIVLASPRLTVAAKPGVDGLGPGETKVVGGPGLYRVTYTVNMLGGAWHRIDGMMMRVLPARGDWSGVLTSGPLTVPQGSN